MSSDRNVVFTETESDVHISQSAINKICKHIYRMVRKSVFTSSIVTARSYFERMKFVTGADTCVCFFATQCILTVLTLSVSRVAFLPGIHLAALSVCQREVLVAVKFF